PFAKSHKPRTPCCWSLCRYQTADGKCWWTKCYLGKHEVAYQGWSEGRGIWGLWEIPRIGRGGFHIWPKGLEDDSSLHAERHAPEPIVRFEGEPDVPIANPLAPQVAP